MSRPRRSALLVALSMAVAGCVAAPSPSATRLGVIAPVPTTVGTLPPATNAVVTPIATITSEARRWAYRVRSTQCLATGSAFALTDRIVTNRHVVSGSSTVQLSTWDGTDINGQVSAISSGPDLGLVARDAMSTSATATLAATDPPPGTAVWAVGYPLGDQLTITPGYVIDYIDGQTLGDQGRLMEITNPIQHGNSGSALVDSDGRVVGVVFAIRTSNKDGLAVPLSRLNAFRAAPGNDVSGACDT
jgi:S1-C subfamily serine protease